MSNAIKWIKRIYLYIFSAVGLILIVVGSVQIINLGLKTFIFTKADIVAVYPRPMPVQKDEDGTQQPSEEEIEKYQMEELVSRRQRQAAGAIAMIIVGLPLFLYHWNIVRKED